MLFLKLRLGKRVISTPGGPMKILLLHPNEKAPVPGILWIHGGGYTMGMASMVHFSIGKMLAKKYGAVVISPEYRLAPRFTYPAALEDCYAALSYLYDHAEALGIDRNRIIVGGESAGGGLAAAVCLYARDKGKIPIAFQLPLYPMLDSQDTDSSRDNHGHVWDTRKNHHGWSCYLGDLYASDCVSKYASAARETDYHHLPPCYTFVSDGEPFYRETLTYVDHLRQAGIAASVDVYHSNTHAFDMLLPWTKNARNAKRQLCKVCQPLFSPSASMQPRSIL